MNGDPPGATVRTGASGINGCRGSRRTAVRSSRRQASTAGSGHRRSRGLRPTVRDTSISLQPDTGSGTIAPTRTVVRVERQRAAHRRGGGAARSRSPSTASPARKGVDDLRRGRPRARTAHRRPDPRRTRRSGSRTGASARRRRLRRRRGRPSSTACRRRRRPWCPSAGAARDVRGEARGQRARDPCQPGGRHLAHRASAVGGRVGRRVRRRRWSARPSRPTGSVPRSQQGPGEDPEQHGRRREEHQAPIARPGTGGHPPRLDHSPATAPCARTGPKDLGRGA